MDAIVWPLTFMLLLHSQVDLVDAGLNVVPGQIVGPFLSGCCFETHQFIHVSEEHRGKEFARLLLFTQKHSRLDKGRVDDTRRRRSPLSVLILNIAESSYGAGQLFPESPSVSDVQRLVH